MVHLRHRREARRINDTNMAKLKWFRIIIWIAAINRDSDFHGGVSAKDHPKPDFHRVSAKDRPNVPQVIQSTRPPSSDVMHPVTPSPIQNLTRHHPPPPYQPAPSGPTCLSLVAEAAAALPLARCRRHCPAAVHHRDNTVAPLLQRHPPHRRASSRSRQAEPRVARSQ
jgi:hypothetical protein